jgi:transposase
MGSIDGLDALAVQTILSEVGLERERFATVKHFYSWLGLCPGQKITDSPQVSQKLLYDVVGAAKRQPQLRPCQLM